MSKNILDEIHAFLGRFIKHPSEEAHVAHTLWIAHAHAMDAWTSTPKIAFLSAEPASGKTRALEITELLVPNPIATANTSTAALFRSIKDKPTILLDEIDTTLGNKAKDSEDLRGLLNASHSRGGVVLRCEGPDNKVTKYAVYSAIALGGLGTLPDTVRSRSIIVRMKKRKQGETVEPYRPRDHGPEGDSLRDKIAAWAEANKEKLTTARPDLPDGVADRDADNWEALLAVADAAGGEWTKKARVTAVTLVTQFQSTGRDDLKHELLSDCRVVFGSEDKLHTITMINRLCELPESPWNNIRGAPITDRFLAKLLSEYEISSKGVRIGDVVKKGYEKGDFVDAWERNLDPLPPSSQEGLQALQELQAPFDPFPSEPDTSQDMFAELERRHREEFA